jgi:hypothetical protein
MGPIVELTCEPLVGAKAEIIRETGTGELVVSLMHNAGRAWPAGAHVQIKKHECRPIPKTDEEQLP